MVSDRDCINLSDIAYLELSDANKGRNLHDIFFEKTGENKYRPRNEFKNSQDSTVKKFMEQLKAFPHYYYPTLANYTLIDTDSSSFTDYNGMACINNENEIVLTDKGTTSLLDKFNDIDMALGNIPPQVSSAFDFYQKVRSYAKGRGLSSITLTGHSLGGSLATFQMLKFYGDGYLKRVKTFEEFGILWCLAKITGFGIPWYIDLANVGLDWHYLRHYLSWDKVKTLYKNSFDFVANSSMHIGNVVDLTKPHLLEIKPGVDVYHSLSTYKMYALDQDGNIVVGKIDGNNLKELKKLNQKEADRYEEMRKDAMAGNQQALVEKHQINQKNLIQIKKLLAEPVI